MGDAVTARGRQQIEEWCAGANRWHRLADPVWGPSDERAMSSTRKALQSIDRSSPAQALPDALKQCFPFEACMLETIHTLRSRDPVDTIYDVPDNCNTARAHLIDQDMAIDILPAVNAGVAFVDVVVVGERQLQRSAYIQALYSRRTGLGGVTGLMVSVKPSWPDGCKVYTTLWFFRGRRSRIPHFHECRRLEALNDDIAEAVHRMQVPISYHASIESQPLFDSEDGYVLLRERGATFDANRRAFELSDMYAPDGIKQREAEKLRKFLQYCETRRDTRILRPDGRAQLLVKRSQQGQYGDLVVYRLEEVALLPDGITPKGELLLSRLDCIEQEIVRMLVSTRIPSKQIAVNMGFELRAFQKRVERIADKLNIEVSRGRRVRPILISIFSRP